MSDYKWALQKLNVLKLHFGISPKSSTDSIDVIDLHGKTKKVTWKMVSPILGARLNELAESVFESPKSLRESFQLA